MDINPVLEIRAASSIRGMFKSIKIASLGKFPNVFSMLMKHTYSRKKPESASSVYGKTHIRNDQQNKLRLLQASDDRIARSE
jgi:hypothetical protein